ncbi:YqiA/YcfP family alpha/beta fold hydrolase [Alysiella filiformis]|uniref:Esterase n=1 Tax=Alysiella filiformis DSM 16848 TaxID=1120981 RepID=A0A286E4E2_9NEIS|nr:YqiA/YcfP family alpha/beta fold hydrolase [Alysiella filiformis]QMT30984.1 alpha/beta fold hydrolase [Alysiella filiformis]UBQ56028.1 alpha/beta fold hydrolase [Alysiella filiformis DSM 16848]SOD65766.1 hypothetical protein SAMN02746062_00414 [Alysiella filiformis DSM 16848]
MQIIYVHGLHSNANSVKGNQLRDYCAAHYPEIAVHSPDLNHKPEQVLHILRDFIAQDEKTVLVGSSLGGFFSTLLHNELGVKAVLLNPSTQPHETLLRFFPENWRNLPDDFVANDEKATTWQMTMGDLRWFERHKPTTFRQPEKLFVLLETGDELLDYRLAAQYYGEQGTKMWISEGGDHRMTGFVEKLPQVFEFILA